MAERLAIGVWWELPPGTRWTNEGVSRVVGFLIEGGAANRRYHFHVVVRRGMADTVREDLRHLAAVEGQDWTVHEPSESGERRALADARARAAPGDDRDTAALALWANAHVPVDGWIITFPHFTGSIYLERSKAVLMPDAIPYDFPMGWRENWGSDGYWPKWRNDARRVCESADAVINFSDHVAERHSGPLLDVDRNKIRVVPLAPPDLLGELDFLKTRERTVDSRAEAAQILREHAASRGIAYLRQFPFEQCDFVVGATQDRPNKNLGLTAAAVETMVRRDRRSLKLFLTASIYEGESWTRLPKVIEGRQFHQDFASLHDLPREVHAALFHAASLTIHASFYEGIIGNLPFYESVGVGTPCLFAGGPHTSELLASEPDLGQFTFDPYDVESLIKLTRNMLDKRNECLAIQQVICARLRKRTWSDVADDYVAAALAGNRLRAA